VYSSDGTVFWSTAQALSEALAEQPALANSVVASLDAATFAWLLTATKGSSTAMLLWSATSPRAQTEADAERAITNVLHLLASLHGLVASDLRGPLGTIIAPWSSRLVALARSGDTYDYTTAWAAAADPAVVGEVRWILAAADAADEVTRWLVTAGAGLPAVLACGPPQHDRVVDWAEQLGIAAARITTEQIGDARRRLAGWRKDWMLPLSFLNHTDAAVANLGIATAFAVTQGLAAIEGQVLDGAATRGALGAPPPIGRVTVDEVQRFELTEVTIIASARRTVFSQLVAARLIPSSAEPPPDVQITSANPMEDDTVAIRTWADRTLPIAGSAIERVLNVGRAVQEGFGRGHDAAERERSGAK
jgi:hypothetical protein